MLKLLAVVTAFIVWVTPVFSQMPDSPAEHNAPNIVYGEVATLLLWGWGSVNYERMLTENVSARVGVGTGYFLRIDDGSAHGDGAVLMINYLPVGIEHRLEIGAGVAATYLRGQESPYPVTFNFFSGYVEVGKFAYFPAASIGYRYQPREGGFFFRTGLTYQNYFALPVQVSLGYTW